MNLGEKIYKLRKEKGYTQKQMAEMLNLSQPTYSRYESGILDIPSSVLISLAKFHKVSVDYLLGLDG